VPKEGVVANSSITPWRVRIGDREIVEEPIWSSDNPSPVEVGPGYSARLRKEGWLRTKRYPHARGGREVAVKYRWEKDGQPRLFTSYRIVKDVPIPLLLADHLDKVIARGQRVWLSESHSDVEALLAAGAFATTNWGSASEWSDDYAEQLRGASVVIVRHRDEAGRAFADKVAWSLRNRARRVRIVEPKAGNDARDHLEAGLGLRDFVEVTDA